MSIGIPRAVDVEKRSFDRWVIELEPQPFARPLSCGGCHARVEPVTGYMTRKGTTVDPLYRLGRGVSHENGCVYDFDAQVGQLHQRNVGVVEKDGDLYVLVLNMELEGEQAASKDAKSGPRNRLAFSRVGIPPLHPTLRAASEIAKLLRKFEHDPAAKARFRARYGRRVIAWENFCFDAAHDLKRLHRMLSTTRVEVDHPRAVVGRVEHVRQRDGSLYLAVRESDPATRGPVRSGEGVPIKPVLRPSSGSALGVAVDETVVGYGMWIPWTPPSGGPHYVTLWLGAHRGAMATL